MTPAALSILLSIAINPSPVQPAPTAPVNPATSAAVVKSAESLILDLAWEEEGPNAWWKHDLLKHLGNHGLFVLCASGTSTQGNPQGCVTQLPLHGRFLSPETVAELRTLQSKRIEAASTASATVNARDKGAKILNEARKKKASVKLVITRRRGDSLEEVTGRVEGDIGDVAIVSTDSEIIAIPTEEIVAARRSLPLTTQFWCADLMTVCWNEETFGFAGLRLLVEPSFSFTVPVQREGFSFSPVNIANSVAIGLEINIVGAWLAGQTYVVSPHSTDLTAADGMTTAAAKSKAGIAFGLSLLNGVVGVGWGLTFWDRTTLPDFASELRDRGAANSQFIYIAIQPVTALRTAFTAIKNGRRKAAAKNE